MPRERNDPSVVVDDRALDCAVDSHVHIASRDEVRYRRQIRGVGSRWWEDPPDADDLIEVMDANGIDRSVVAQAVGVYGFDNSYLLDACATHPDRLAPLPAADSDAQVREMTARADVVGIRCFLVGGTSVEVVRSALELARTVVLTGWLHQLVPLLGLVGGFPFVPVIIDHCGLPDWSSADDWEALGLLAQLTHVSVKFTGHLLHESTDAKASFDRLASLFGTSRIIAGSDFPQASRNYAATWSELRSLGRSDGAHYNADFLGRNASRIWFDRRT